LTLKFLGEVGREQVSRITEKLDSAASKVDTFTVEVEGIGCFPSCKRPRIIWIGVQADQTPLKDLQSDIEADMEQLGFDREQRRFHPHLTVGRLKRSASNAQRRALAQELELIQVGHLGKIEVSGITLMRSELHPTGAEYTQLHRAALG
jgi:2'-5' RNA ligase